jgi:hypothetical protein
MALYLNEVRDLAEQGLSKYEICKQLQCTDKQCCDALRYHNLVAVSKKQRVINLHKEGKNRAYIMETLDISQGYMDKTILDYKEPDRIAPDRPDLEKQMPNARREAKQIWLPLVCIDGRNFEPIAKRLGLIKTDQFENGRALFELPDGWEKFTIRSLGREGLNRPNPHGAGLQKCISNYFEVGSDSDLFGVELFNID